MHILVTGANGQLGREMRLTAVGTAHNYYFTDIKLYLYYFRPK